MDQFLEKLRNKINLNFDESKDAFKILMNGDASDQQIWELMFILKIYMERIITILLSHVLKV